MPTFITNSEDIDQTDVVAEVSNTAGLADPPGTSTPRSDTSPLSLLRRRSQLSASTPKSLDFEALYDNDNQSETTEESQEDNDLEQQQQEEKKSSNNNNKKKRFTKKRIIWMAVWLFIVIGLVVGLVVAFQGSNAASGNDTTSTSTSRETSSTSAHDKEVPPQQQEKEPATTANDPDFSLGMNETDVGSNENVTDRIEDTDSNSTDSNSTNNTSPPKDTAPELSEWPELVGMNGEEAKAFLEEQYGVDTYHIIIHHEFDPVTKDFRWDRIRLFVDDDGNVVTTPRIG